MQRREKAHIHVMKEWSKQFLFQKYVFVLRAAEKLSTELPAIKEETKNLEKTSTHSDDDFVVLMTKMRAKHKAILGYVCNRFVHFCTP